MILFRYLPEGTEIFVPPYVLHRQEQYFSSPDSFIPSRWLHPSPSPSSPPTTTSHSKEFTATATSTPLAFIPFSYGPQSCAGRQLARTEMLIIASLLLHQFEFELDDNIGEGSKLGDMKNGKEASGGRNAWDEGYMDWFVSTRGQLRLKLRLREHAKKSTISKASANPID